MACERITAPGIGTIIMCSRGTRRRRCAFCSELASHLCDGAKPRRKSGTCDRALCGVHRTEICKSIEGVTIDDLGSREPLTVRLQDTIDLCPDCVAASEAPRPPSKGPRRVQLSLLPVADD